MYLILQGSFWWHELIFPTWTVHFGCVWELIGSAPVRYMSSFCLSLLIFTLLIYKSMLQCWNIICVKVLLYDLCLNTYVYCFWCLSTTIQMCFRLVQWTCFIMVAVFNFVIESETTHCIWTTMSRLFECYYLLHSLNFNVSSYSW